MEKDNNNQGNSVFRVKFPQLVLGPGEEEREKKKKSDYVAGRIRTCAGRPQWISSPSP